jgi:hypothetical protein
MTVSNSKIFTDAVFGLSTSKTANELTANDTHAQETYLEAGTVSNMSTRVPRVPSNQRVAKDK